jgi:hypothetical protein
MAGIREGSVLIARFVAPMSVISNRPTYAADTLSLKRKTGSQGGAQRWEIQTQVEPLRGSAELMVNMVVAGEDIEIDVEMPQVYGVPNGTSATAAVVSTATAAGSATVPITLTGTRISKGEFIRFANHNKVYMVTATRTGSGGLSVFPNLVADVALSEVISFGTTGVIMKALYDSSTIKGMIYTDGVLQDPGQITLIESL